MYNVVIERGNNPKNDRLIDWVKERVRGKWLDIGCNTGWLLSEVPNGIGVDKSPLMVWKAMQKGLDVLYCDAIELPFENKSFDTAVLSCVLEQCENWRKPLEEAIRVANRVIGFNPYPGRSKWGTIGGWRKAVISPDDMQEYGAKIKQFDDATYYFEIGE